MKLINEGYIKARGKRKQYDSNTYEDIIYFATDTGEIILNDKVYGTSEEALSSITGRVSNLEGSISNVYTKKEVDTKISNIDIPDSYDDSELRERVDNIENNLYGDNTNGYEYVDMGEAGIWSKYPIGVTELDETIFDKVKYFAWGETKGYTKEQIGIDRQFSQEEYKLNSKYGESKLHTLEEEDDAAHINMGGDWRMPTVEELNKLVNLCNYKFIENYNNSGINGFLLTLKSNNNKQLFFPHLGYYLDGNNNLDVTDIYTSSYRSRNNIYNLRFYNNVFIYNFSTLPYKGTSIFGFIPYDKVNKYLSKKEAEELEIRIINSKQDKLPEGEVGQVLTKTEDGVEWSNYSHTGGESTLPNYIEADKLKKPVMLWGNEFDGSGDVNGNIDLNDFDLLNVNTIIFSGNQNIDFSDIEHFKSALDEVTKAADDSEIFKKITIISKLGISTNIYPNGDYHNGDFRIQYGAGIDLNPIVSGSPNKNDYCGVQIIADTNYLATRSYVDDKINFLVNSEGELEDSFDTLKEVDTWIKEHEGEAADIISKQNAIEVWKDNISKLRLASIQGGMYHSTNNVQFGIYSYDLDGNNKALMDTQTINSATSEKAGVMSATDKVKLDKTPIIYNSNSEAISEIYLDIPGNSTSIYTKGQVDDLISTLTSQISEEYVTKEDLPKSFYIEITDSGTVKTDYIEDIIYALSEDKLNTTIYLKIYMSFDLSVYVPTNIIEFDNSTEEHSEIYLTASYQGVQYLIMIDTEEESIDLQTTIENEPISEDTINSWFNDNNEE